MENIIQQIALDLVEKITKKAFEAKISDIDTLASDVLADCKTAACEILEAAVAQLNESIRKEKATRKELGLILKEKNRKRSILTELGTLNPSRDYFFDKTCDRYVFVLDAMLGLQRYERISGNVRTKLVTEACEVSYAKSAQIVTVEGYIQKAYAIDSIEKIYVHADGGRWIRSGLKDFAQTEHVLDGFHLEKYLRRISARFPKKNLRVRFCKAFEQNDRKKADQMLQELYAEAEGDKRQIKAVKEFGSYIRNNWEEIVRRKRLDIPGSCTEGQISHVLSERFSRDPMGWSEECLGKLSQARVYLKNGGTLTKEDFKGKDEKLNGKEKYREYAQRMMKEADEGCFDWSIFEKPIVPMDKASGTQILIESLGESRNILYC